MYDFLDKIGLKAVLEAIKGKIPASLPANGGNADTLDGLHADDFAKSTNPIINGDMIFERDSSQQTISAIYSASDMLILRNTTKDASSFCDVMISNDGVRIVNANQNFKIGDGGNADTVDGYHAAAFLQNTVPTNIATSINDMTTAGTYGVYSITPDFPVGYGSWGFLEVRRYGNLCYQSIIFETGIVITRGKDVTLDRWNDWCQAYTNLNKPYVTGSATAAANSNVCVSNHGFIPSAIIWWDGEASGVSAAFDDTQFTINKINTYDRTIGYLIFK